MESLSYLAPKVFITSNQYAGNNCHLLDVDSVDDDVVTDSRFRDDILLEVLCAVSSSLRNGRKTIYICPKNTRTKKELMNCLCLLKLDFTIEADNSPFLKEPEAKRYV